MKNRFRIYLAAIVCLILLKNVSTQEPEPESEGSTETNVDDQSCDNGSGTCVDECDASFMITDTGCESGKACCANKCNFFVGVKGFNGICRPESECNSNFPGLPFWKGNCREGEKCCDMISKITLPTP
ncbi:CLUMA_CG019539, isoform A [Clunio marinus]|uniref:CLUMA_CG019539, isoform A n=1 Tax=Clunio marinus TaxID=568069 RepID=A0A1J1J3C1_9DIPT|nr:CLUMA_CG019539, isoform A [Clunio marinus]